MKFCKSLLFILPILLVLPIKILSQYTVNISYNISANKEIIEVPKEQKKSYLNNINTAPYIKKNSSNALSTNKPNNDVLTALIGENQFVELSITNTSKTNRQFQITTNFPDSWNLAIRKRVMLPDWYSFDQGNPKIYYYGDALPLLNKINRTWTLPVSSGEVANIILDYEVNSKSNAPLEIRVKDMGSGKITTCQLNLKVLEKRFPSTVPFNSIAFNSNNDYSYTEFTQTLKKYEFNILVVNYVPQITFDRNGNIVVPIKKEASQTQGFISTAIPWIKQGGKIALFWQPRYNKFALTRDGNSLPIYSSSWNRAFVNEVLASVQLIKSHYPALKNEQIILYVADEITSRKYDGDISEEVKGIQSLLKYIKQQIPQFKTLVSFGYISYPKDINAVMPYTDILLPHFIMPESYTEYAPQSYNPALAFKERFSQYRNNQQCWLYMVEKGKSSPLPNFTVLPMLAVLKKAIGLSWYAFSDRRGSSWISNDGGRLDYGLFYLKEPNVSLYTQSVKGLSNAERIIPSIRLVGAKIGIQNAKLLQYLLENRGKLNRSGQEQLNKIVSRLKTLFDIYDQPKKNFESENINIVELSNDLRLLFNQI